MYSFTTPSVFEALDLIMKYYPDNYTEEAKAEIEILLDHCLDDAATDSEKLLATLFIKALKNFIGPVGADEHIYLRKFEIPQIELFNLLIEQFPLVKQSHEITNSSIAAEIGDSSCATIIDVGIGQGVQMVKLVEKLASSSALKRLTIIGIEPFYEALEVAQQKLSGMQAHFQIEFHAIHAFVEEVDFDTIRNIVSQSSGPLLINGSLAMHHIPSLEGRHHVLECLSRLCPHSFFLAEPNVDHFEPDFYKRFQNCYGHFFHVFQVIDHLPVSNYERNGLKLFFGREIEDIIGKGNHQRFEKHEPAYRWIEKLNIHGFKSVNRFSEVPANIHLGIDISYNHQGFLSFKFKSEVILGLIHVGCSSN
jgi:hypothetical protein